MLLQVGKFGDACTDGEGVLGDLLFKNLKSLDENSRKIRKSCEDESTSAKINY